MAKKDAPIPRVKRSIQNMVDMAIPPIVKSSIYPWDSLIPQEGDESEAPARNFLVECADQEEAEKLRSSVYSSGRSYYQKRGTGLMPLCRVVENPPKSGNFGIGCWAVPDVG